MFGLPGETEFDLRFRLLGLPVRVHPLFWVVSAVLAGRVGDVKAIFLWIACVFVSILVHEFGHALIARMHGADPSVILYSMGGLCVYQDSREGRWQRLFVLIMGPGAGFLLAGLTIGVASLWLGISPVGVLLDDYTGARTVPSHYAMMALVFLKYINIAWGVFNLMPIMPLDGGQIATIFLSMHDRRQGPRRAYILSVVTAGLVAVYMVKIKLYYNALFLGLLAFSSFQMVQALHYQSRYGSSFDDDADWWKR